MARAVSPSPRLRWLFWPMTVFLALLLLVRALELRIPEMTRPFWEDEIHHNEPVLASADMTAFEHKYMFRAMYQPKLDFWLRHEVWFPMLGRNERALRIPALVYSEVLVLLVYGLLIAFFWSRVERRWAPLLAFVASIWIVDNPLQVHYAAEARHYTFIALASTLWFALLLLYQGKPRWLFAAASLLFANTHFFALPVIAGGYGLQILSELRARRYGWVVFQLGVCLLIGASIAHFSWVPLHALLTAPPGSKRAPLGTMFALPSLQAGFEVWVNYLRVLGVPPWGWVVWLTLLITAIRSRQTRWFAPLVAVFLILPVFFLYMQFRSTQPIHRRYFSAFFGLGLIALIAGLDWVFTLWRRFAPRLSVRTRPWAVALLLLVFACSFSAPAFAYRVVADWQNIHSLPKNFSPYYRAYAELAQEEKPMLFVIAKCYTSDSAGMYLNFLVPHPKASMEWTELRCWKGAEYLKARKTIRSFLSSHGASDGIVVLDQKDLDCEDRAIPSFPAPTHVEKVRAMPCMWKVSGVTTPRELSTVATALGFAPASEIR